VDLCVPKSLYKGGTGQFFFEKKSILPGNREMKSMPRRGKRARNSLLRRNVQSRSPVKVHSPCPFILFGKGIVRTEGPKEIQEIREKAVIKSPIITRKD